MPSVPKKKEAESSRAPSNMFSLLAETDSDEEKEPEVPVPPVPAPQPPASPPFRTWPKPSKEEQLERQGKSPFHRPRRRQLPKEHEDGWVSLKTLEMKAQPEDTDKSITITYEPRTPPFYDEGIPPRTPPGEFDDVELPPPVLLDQKYPSLLTRGKGGELKVDPAPTEPAPCDSVAQEPAARQPEIILSETISRPAALEEMSALAWAERVKKSLERAEAPRAHSLASGSAADSRTFGKMSFFRSK
jgi:hypothetical protein